MQDSGVLTSQLREKIDGCLRTHGEYLVRKSGEFQKISNWGVLQDHGLLLLGVYLDRSEWTALALKRLDENLHRSVMADGSQWEQSPMYHCEVLHNAADALLVARQNKVAVPVRFEENVHKMFRALAAWTKPNGNLPCQSDSDDADARDILAMGALLFEDPVPILWKKTIGTSVRPAACVWHRSRSLQTNVLRTHFRTAETICCVPAATGRRLFFVFTAAVWEAVTAMPTSFILTRAVIPTSTARSGWS